MTNKIIKQYKDNNNNVTITECEKTKASKTFAIHDYPLCTTKHKEQQEWSLNLKMYSKIKYGCAEILLNL